MKKSYFYKSLKKGILNNNIDQLWFQNILTKKDSLFFNENPEELIKENFSDIIDAVLNNVNPNMLKIVLEYLYKNSNLKDFINEQLMFILNKACEKVDIFPSLIDSEIINFKEFFNNNFDSFIDSLTKQDLIKYCSEDIQLIYWLNGIDESIKNKIISMYEKADLLKTIIKYSYLGNLEGDQYNTVYETAALIIDDVAKNENKEFKDISVLGQGRFSLVFKIGDKVVKLGKSRETFDIPNHYRIIQPDIRVNALKTDGINFNIEVTEMLDTNINVSIDECYQIYKEFRDYGVIPIDFKPENLGYLLKENKVRWNKAISDDMSSRGLYGEIDKVLQPGEIVLLDTDFIYNESEVPKIEAWPSLLSREFETKYQNELSQNKGITK